MDCIKQIIIVSKLFEDWRINPRSRTKDVINTADELNMSSQFETLKLIKKLATGSYNYALLIEIVEQNSSIKTERREILHHLLRRIIYWFNKEIQRHLKWE